MKIDLCICMYKFECNDSNVFRLVEWIGNDLC